MRWNAWRKANVYLHPNLDGAQLQSRDIQGFDFSHTSLRNANLSHSFTWNGKFYYADLTGANLRSATLENSAFNEATIHNANMSFAHIQHSKFFRVKITDSDLSFAGLGWSDFTDATLSNCKLHHASLLNSNLFRADFRGSDLSHADLRDANLVETNFTNAILDHCEIYGISVWNVNLIKTRQADLLIGRPWVDPYITVDSLEMGQFIYLLLNNQKLHEVIDTITSKVVLILGRFTKERKSILDQMRDSLRRRNYSPILFDFNKPASRDTIETISTLAHLSRFIIVDLTDAKSVLQELQRIIPSLPSVPIQPIILSSDHVPGMIDHFRNYRSFLRLYQYEDSKTLADDLDRKVISPAEQYYRRLLKGI